MTVKELRAQLFEVDDQDAQVIVIDVGGQGGSDVFASRLEVGTYIFQHDTARPIFRLDSDETGDYGLAVRLT